MKKFIMGLIIGIAITTSATAYGEEIIDTIIGKQVQGEFPVTLGGKKLDKKAAVVDGTSYLPVRAIGEALNMDVSFNADLGIELKNKGDVQTLPQTEIDQKQSIDQTKLKIKKANVKINGDHIKENDHFEYVEIDGNQYISAVGLSDPYTVKRNNNEIVTVSFSLDDNIVEIPMNKEYYIGTDSFIVDGITVFKISLLGLTAHIEGDTLIIEKQ